jgi:hypothetical protein
VQATRDARHACQGVSTITEHTAVDRPLEKAL